MKKVFALIITVVCISFSMALIAFAGEWKQDEKGWWYENDDGSYPVNQWQEIAKKKYYFNETGYMQTADITLENITYHFDESGACTNPFGETITTESGSIDYSNWIPYDTGSLATLAEDLSKGRVVCIDGQYYASPEYANMMATPNVHVHDVSPAPPVNRHIVPDQSILDNFEPFDYGSLTGIQ